MLFPTVGFALFLAVVFLAAWLARPWPALWRAVLLLASIVFFGWWDWRACLVLAGLVVVTQVGAVGVHRASTAEAARVWLAGVVAVGVVTFVVVARIGIGEVDLGVVVPLGLGLLVLRCFSYVIDVHRGELTPAPLADAALALSFFPAAVAGPLVRPAELLPQLADPPDGRRLPAARAFRLLVVGLALLWVIAPYLDARLVGPVFAAPDEHSALEVIVAAYGATVELFAQLAGYASMAVGTALLLGLRLPGNFDAPFTATSLRDLWRRWTTTFTAWLRRYLYVPLGGDRLGDTTTVRNIVLTTLASALWFFGGWSGLAWGVVMSAALIVERRMVAEGPRRGAAAVLGWFVTFQVATFGWFVVRAGDLGQVGELLARLVAWGEAPLVTPLALAVIAGMVAIQFLPPSLPQAVDVAFSRLPLVAQAVAVAVTLLVIAALGQTGFDPVTAVTL